ncbi:MAG: SEL1-like repeat protein [Ruminococcus sp.]|uniref:relaxase MobL n=1 Tax=Ruminococcus sp. TaxID=41978 RepID=UPI0025FD7EDC|nr:relaxase MobL [Ruminococcus sp.]MBQ9542644.1 SEL1-like repeat protein [Ruminococcus sp.]MBR0530504.1 SEL1-like repeat protein [Ruminococcus sp.]
MASPAVVFKLQYLYSWYIRDDKKPQIDKYDFLDYMTRPDALKFRADKHKDDEEYRDFIDYMRNDEKSEGAFDSTRDLLDAAALADYRDNERTARDGECPKYSGVISFDNKFLVDNGLMFGNQIDHHRLKGVARKSISQLIQKSDKLSADHVKWVAAIHENTDNIHIHFELFPLTRSKPRDPENVNQDCIEQSAIDALKSSVANSIINYKHTPEITRIKREILFPQLSDAMGDAEKMLLELANKLPRGIPMQYGNHRMKPFHREIDRCVDEIIGSDAKLKSIFHTYTSSLDMMDDQYTRFYGEKSRAATYSDNQLADFYNRAGNILLKHLKEMQSMTSADRNSDELKARLYPQGVSVRKEKKESDALKKYLIDNNKYISNYKVAKNALDLIKNDGDIQLLESVANISDTAAFALGLHYADDKRGEKYLHMSAENNNRDAQYMLGKLYLRGEKKEDAAHWLRRSADNDHAYAQFAYGMMLVKSGHRDEGYYYLHYSQKNGNKIAHKVMQSLKKQDEREKTDSIINKVPQEPQTAPHSFRYDRDDDTDTTEHIEMSAEHSEKPTTSEGGYYLEWTDSYKEACKLIYSKKSEQKDHLTAEKMLLSEAESGNVLALNELGKLYGTELLGAADKEMSDSYYKAAFKAFCVLENTDAKHKSYIQYRIGKMYTYGLGVDADDDKAFQYFTSAAMEGNKYAMYSLANCYMFGKGTASDHKQAFLWYSKASEKGMLYATYAVAQMYQNGDGTDKSIELADHHYRIALSAFLKLYQSEQADDNLIYKIGTMYKNGLGTDIDKAKAIKFFALAAKQNNKNAQYEYGKALIEGADTAQNIPDGIDYLKRAANAGNDNAGKYLASEYISGKHIPITVENVQQAVQIYTRLADKGDSRSAYRLGKIYLEGTVTAKNNIKAEHYLMQAYNDPEQRAFAAYSLGKLYASDKQTKYKAVKYFAAAADSNSWASYQLGKLYLSDRNTTLAQSWLTRSANDGNKAAKDMLKFMQPRKKAPMIRRSVANSTYTANMCWSQMKSIIDELETHTRQLQAEFDYENQIADDEFYDYIPTY